jgi:hypothetical protein
MAVSRGARADSWPAIANACISPTNLQLSSPITRRPRAHTLRAYLKRLRRTSRDAPI